MDCDEMSSTFETPTSQLKVEVADADHDKSSVSVQCVESRCNLFPYKTLSPLKAVDNSAVSRSQQRRSSPMDYRQLAGMRPKTWLVQSAESRHLKADDNRSGRVSRRNGHRYQSDGVHARQLSLTPELLNRIGVSHAGKDIGEDVKQCCKKTEDSPFHCNISFESNSVYTLTAEEPGNILALKSFLSSETSDVCSDQQPADSPELRSGSAANCDDSQENTEDQSSILLPCDHEVLSDHTYYSKYRHPHQKLHHIADKSYVACQPDVLVGEGDYHEVERSSSPSNFVVECLCSLEDLDRSIVLQYPEVVDSSVATNLVDASEPLVQCVTDTYLNTSCSTETASNCSFAQVHDEGLSINEELADESSFPDSLYGQVAVTNLNALPVVELHFSDEKTQTNCLEKLPKSSKSVKDSEHHVDTIDEVTFVSFKSEWQLKKYVSWHCRASGILSRRITSGSSVRRGKLHKKRNSRCFNSTRLLKTEEFEWQINRGNIKKVTEEELDKLGLRITPVREDMAINMIPSKHAIRRHRQTSQHVKCRAKRMYSSLNCARKRVRSVLSYNLRAAKVVNVLGEEKEDNDCDKKLEFVTVTPSQARACSECIHVDWMDSGGTCVQPGCAYGCICRLFKGKRFSRMVANSYKQNLLNSEAYATCLKAEISRLGYGRLLSSEAAKRTIKPKSSIKRPKPESGKKHNFVRNLSFDKRKSEKKRKICSMDNANRFFSPDAKDVPQVTSLSPDCSSPDGNSIKNLNDDIKAEKRLAVISHTVKQRKPIDAKRHFVRNRSLKKQRFGNRKTCSEENNIPFCPNDIVGSSTVSESDIVSSTSSLPAPDASSTLSMAKDTIETPTSAASSSNGISSISNERIAVDEEQSRNSSDGICQRFEDRMETDESVPLDPRLTTIDSSQESRVQQTFRRQMVLFQHNQNGGRPCLLEIMSNCSWDSARSALLGRLFAVTADSAEYPPICTFIVDTFRVEIQPRASQKTPIPTDLRNKLGVSKMYAVRVRVTVDGRPDLVGCLTIDQQARQSTGAVESTLPWSTTRPNFMGNFDNFDRLLSDQAAPIGDVDPSGDWRPAL